MIEQGRNNEANRFFRLSTTMVELSLQRRLTDADSDVSTEPECVLPEVISPPTNTAATQEKVINATQFHFVELFPNRRQLSRTPIFQIAVRASNLLRRLGL